MDLQQQYERNKNIEIVGLKKVGKGKEDLLGLATKIARKMQIENFNKDVIDKIQRIPRKVKSANKEDNIVVQFKSRSDRDIWIQKRKVKITNAEIQENSGDSNIYVNEHLTPKQKFLFWNTKNMAKNNGWKYVWIKDGKILCRRQEGLRCILITNEEDLAQIESAQEEDEV